MLISLFAAACCGCNPAAAAASTVFFSLWIAAAAVQTAATVSACSQPNTPKEFFLRISKKIIGNGENTTSFESDVWCGVVPFAEKFKRLFDFIFHKNISVAKALYSNLTNLRFRRRIYNG
jgi:hypothetical protein